MGEGFSNLFIVLRRPIEAAGKFRPLGRGGKGFSRKSLRSNNREIADNVVQHGGVEDADPLNVREC